MLFKSTLIASVVAFAALSYAPSTEAHVGGIFPCPPRAPQCEPQEWQGGKPDYDHFRPISNTFASKPPKLHHKICRYVESKTLLKSAVKKNVFSKGQTIKTMYDANNAHKGGSCQWAITYDVDDKIKEPKWVVFKDIQNTCLKGVKNRSKPTIDVKLPKGIPGGKAIFAWIFNNIDGNREFYSTCSYITIKGDRKGTIKGYKPLIVNIDKKSYKIPEGMSDKKEKLVEALFANQKKKNPITVTKK
ncbi:hypothetical protein BGX34_006328 [Mortierella sp. NVP85]|nr:hypothetical protein BGX34_006328 [Mortierella sp. NVP85]